MKKIIAAILVLVMLCAACSTLAEETEKPVFETYGDVWQAAGNSPVTGGNDDCITIVLEKDGKILRVVTYLDETAREKLAVLNTELSDEEYIVLDQEYFEYLCSLPVSYTEEITAVPLDQETLNNFVGKTWKDLENAGFDMVLAGLFFPDLEMEDADAEPAEELQDSEIAVIDVSNGMYRYFLTLDITRGEYIEFRENDRQMDDLTIRNINYAGPSWNAANPDYLPDGTFNSQDEPIDLSFDMDNIDFGEATDVMNILMEFINGKDVADIDTEALFDSLIKLMPDKGNEIRTMIPALLDIISQQQEESDSD